ncbi:hypothetical protein DVH24_027892 [Malus domestica]|uniref:Uncharacterized protein n=1 Tax=Malus domestica TaxID=3750 RepID=A0A498HE73_MALDO|nr:hypothetical protein DVH24_027892 [Malus domestica]
MKICSNKKEKTTRSSLLRLIHQATKYRLGEVAGRSKVEQDQMLASGFEGQTSVKLVRSYSSYRLGPITRLQSQLPGLLLGPQADLLGLPLPPSRLTCPMVDLEKEAPVSRTRAFPVHRKNLNLGHVNQTRQI